MHTDSAFLPGTRVWSGNRY